MHFHEWESFLYFLAVDARGSPFLGRAAGWVVAKRAADAVVCGSFCSVGIPAGPGVHQHVGFSTLCNEYEIQHMYVYDLCAFCGRLSIYPESSPRRRVVGMKSHRVETHLSRLVSYARAHTHTHTHTAIVLLAVVCFRVFHCANGSEGRHGMYSDPTVVVKTGLQARPLPSYHTYTHT